MKRFFLIALKILLLLLFVGTFRAQIPELRYDFGTKTPAPVRNVEDLQKHAAERNRFVSVSGRPDFSRAFTYRSHGLTASYFLVEPYNDRLIVRTYDEIEDDWEDLDTFVGRLRPFNRQPFSHRVYAAFADQFDVHVPTNAFVVMLYDVPDPSGWQIGALIFSTIAGAVLVYFSFFWRRKKR